MTAIAIHHSVRLSIGPAILSYMSLNPGSVVSLKILGFTWMSKFPQVYIWILEFEKSFIEYTWIWFWNEFWKMKWLDCIYFCIFLALVMQIIKQIHHQSSLQFSNLITPVNRGWNVLCFQFFLGSIVLRWPFQPYVLQSISYTN